MITHIQHRYVFKLSKWLESIIDSHKTIVEEDTMMYLRAIYRDLNALHVSPRILSEFDRTFLNILVKYHNSKQSYSIYDMCCDIRNIRID